MIDLSKFPLLLVQVSGEIPRRMTMLGPSDVSQDIEKAERQASRQLSSPDGTPPYPASYSGSNDDSSIELSRRYTHRDIISNDIDPPNQIELERQRTHLSIYSNTVGRTVNKYVSKDELPPFGAGKEYPPLLPHRDQYVVDFEGHSDPMHGQNWPLKKK